MAPSSASLAHSLIIQDSWTRCREFGLSHQSPPAFGNLPRADVSCLLDRHQALVQTTHQQVLPYYENILSNSNCLILLADRQGQLLKSWGAQRFVDPAQTQGFTAGANWNERGTGTNAIGTALACEQAIHIEPDEHFLKANRFMTGSAAPIFDAERRLIAVLDVSSDSFLPPSHTLGMVKMMSQSIENRLILDRFNERHFQLIFNTGLNNLDSQWAGLLIFDESGRIQCANRRADNLLGTSPSGVNIEALFRVPLPHLLSEPEGRPFALHALGNNRFQCLLKRPRGQSSAVCAVVPAPLKSAVPSPDFEGIDLGDEQVAKAVRQAQRLVEKDIPLLIHGETGVGKDVFVRALHQASSRAGQPLIAVNCAAIPAELVESELFGYARGAFTGAHHKGSVGLIRKADKGTLFLDEIGDMPISVQARLLRVLQERCVQPLGSSEQYPVDIRVVSATNRCLRDEVQLGRFRQDLYYRISGLNIELPPLRDRTDKRALIQRICERHRDAHQRGDISREALRLFEQHPWPGNLRQLNSVIQVALALADDEPVGIEHLPEDFMLDAPERAGHCASVTAISPQAALNEDLNGLLQAAGGNISQLAKRLGVSRNTLYKRLREQQS